MFFLKLDLFYASNYFFEKGSEDTSEGDYDDGANDDDEDERFFTRVDDMIFLSKQVKAGLSSYNFRWPNGIIPYEIQQGLRMFLLLKLIHFWQINERLLTYKKTWRSLKTTL